MADFKIKSAAGIGNKTLIQGQDQTDSNYAIEIGDGGASTLHNATLTTATNNTPNYIFKAYKTGTQSYTSGQWALVTWDADAHSSWDAGTSKGFDLTNNYYVTPATGNYHIGISGRMSDAGSGGWIMILTKNQAAANSGAVTVGNQGLSMVTEHESSYIDTNATSGVMALTAGDILRVYVANNMGGTEDLQAASDGGYQTFFYGYKIF